MRIGFVSTRLAGVDGVSLETAKLARVLEEMGHETFYCAGELDSHARPGHLVPAMHFQAPLARALYQEAFRSPTAPMGLHQRIYAEADSLRGSLEAFIDEFKIDLIVSQNASAIPMNISLGVAIADTIRRRQIKAICHNHDFYWERDHFIHNHIQDILDEAFPPRLATAHHFVISTGMQRRLAAWRGIAAQYVPNVWEFETPPPPLDDYALSFRSTLGLSDDDLIVLQPTRVIRRKAIEKSIELVRRLADRRLVLIITGYEHDEPTRYGAWLREEADRAGIRYQFIGEYVGAERGEVNGHRVFTLWDIYPQAHIVTYPSVYEGFGNALIETLYYRIPLVVHTYPPYLADIKPCGVQAVEFYHDITPEVLDGTRAIIDNASLRAAMVENNFEVGLKSFSFTVLRRALTRALDRLENHD
jgi:glycosyltransferase involved in cell wall biosynthesis